MAITVKSYKKQVQEDMTPVVLQQGQNSLQSEAAAIQANQMPQGAFELQKLLADLKGEPGRAALAVKAAGAKANEFTAQQAASTSYEARHAAAQSSGVIGDAMKFVAGRMTEMQRDLDEAAVMQATSEWNKAVNAWEIDPDKGYKNTRILGGAAGVMEDTNKHLDEVEKSLTQTLTNDTQRNAFQKFVAQNRIAAENEAARYESGQIRQNKTQQAKSLVQSEISAAVEHPLDFETHFATALKATVGGILAGADADTKARAAAELRSDFQTAMIDKMVGDNPIDAESYFNRYQNEILPENRIELQNKVERASMPAKAQNLYVIAKGDYAAAMTWIEKNVPQVQQNALRSAFQSYYSDMDSIKTVTYRKTNEDFAKKYLSRGLSMGDIAGAVKSGALDAAGALTWQNRLEADHDRAVAKAERAAAQAENQRDREAYKNERLFTLSLRHMTPIQQQYAEYEHYYGVTPAMVNKNYSNAMKKADAGKLTFDDVAALQANAQVIPMQAEQLNGRVKGQATVAGKKYDAAMARGRSYLDKLLGKANISNSLIQDALANYDDLAIGGNLDPKEFTNVALDVAYKTLYSKDVQKTEFTLNPLKGFNNSTAAGDVFNQVVELRGSAKSKTTAPAAGNGTAKKPATSVRSAAGQHKQQLNDILFGN